MYVPNTTSNGTQKKKTSTNISKNVIQNKSWGKVEQKIPPNPQSISDIWKNIKYSNLCAGQVGGPEKTGAGKWQEISINGWIYSKF